MRLIDADGLKKLTTERNEIWDAVTDSHGRGLTEIIDSLPAVDVAPVVHAHWKDAVQGCHDSPHVICSACGEYYWQYFKTFHYCPDCGAKMDEVSG